LPQYNKEETALYYEDGLAVLVEAILAQNIPTVTCSKSFTFFYKAAEKSKFITLKTDRRKCKYILTVWEDHILKDYTHNDEGTTSYCRSPMHYGLSSTVLFTILLFQEVTSTQSTLSKQ